MTKNTSAVIEPTLVEEVTTLTPEQQEAIELAANLEVHSGSGKSVQDESVAEVTAIVNSDTMNVSQKIRALHRAGYKNATIQKLLNPWYSSKTGRELRYQHVRNVVMQPTKKA